MLVLPANNKSGWVHYWAGRGQAVGKPLLGHLWSPSPTKITHYPWLPYALDNGAFVSFSQGRPWSPDLFLEFCEQSLYLPERPMFILCPDKVADREATLELWAEWSPKLRKYNAPIAFAIQNGMTPSDIPESADWLFVGGTDDWRFPRLPEFLEANPERPIHVGRINGKKIWAMERLGIASVDGTGFFRGDTNQLGVLEHFLKCQLGEAEPPNCDQIELFGDAPQIIYMRRWLEPLTRSRGLPRNIERSHILKAIANWSGVPKRNQPTKYAVSYDGNCYPPKLLLSRANFWANGQVLPTSRFSGGRDLHRFLTTRGFDIERVR